MWAGEELLFVIKLLEIYEKNGLTWKIKAKSQNSKCITMKTIHENNNKYFEWFSVVVNLSRQQKIQIQKVYLARWEGKSIIWLEAEVKILTIDKERVTIISKKWEKYKNGMRTRNWVY